MKKMLFFAGLIIFFGVTVLFIGIQQSAAQGTKVNFVISTDNPKPLHQEVYGFNTNMATGDYAYSDKSIVDITTRLKPIVLRFPGGTVANQYHWQLSGFKREEMMDADSKKERERNIRNLEKLQERRKGVLSFDEFMTLCNKLNIRPILVVNLFTGTPSESAAWVKQVKEKGYKVFGWELGNELYLPSYRNKIKNFSEYINVARKHAQAMKAVDPKVRLAVVGHPGAFDLLDAKRVASSDRWNETLGKENFFDAYTAHMYVKVNDFFGEKPDINDNLKTGLFEVTDAMFDRAVKTYGNAFKGKELWVTEWNLMFFDSKEMADTLLHAMYCGDFFISMVNTDIITNSDYHVLAGPWNGFPLISATKDPDEHTKRACYHSFDVMKDAMTASHKKFSVKVENNPFLKKSNKYTSNPVMGISAASVGTQRKTFILIANRTSDDIPANITLNNSRITGKVKYSYVSAGSLQSKGENNKIEVKTISDMADKLVLPSNSFGVIEIL